RSFYLSSQRRLYRLVPSEVAPWRSVQELHSTIIDYIPFLVRKGRICPRVSRMVLCTLSPSPISKEMAGSTFSVMGRKRCCLRAVACERRHRMTNNDHEREEAPRNDLSRRDLVVLSVAAGLAVAAGEASAAALKVVESNVEVETPEGK